VYQGPPVISTDGSRWKSMYILRVGNCGRSKKLTVSMICAMHGHGYWDEENRKLGYDHLVRRASTRMPLQIGSLNDR
jgi:hypothetical protein